METTAHEKVELYVNCQNLKDVGFFSKSDPQVWLYVKDNDQWDLCDKTEVIKHDLNPAFCHSFILNYTFGVTRSLLFKVFDVDATSQKLIGEVETVLDEIICADRKTLTMDLTKDSDKSKGKLTIKADNVRASCNIVTLHFSASKLINTDGLFGKSDPFLKIFKVRSKEDYLQVHRTEVVKNNLNPEWKPFQIKDYKLCGTNYFAKFIIECWDWEKNGKHQYIGKCEVSLNDLKNKKILLELHNENQEDKLTGYLHVKRISFEERPSFHHFIKNTNQLNIVLGIDFSKANNQSKSPLHAKNDDEDNYESFNEYQKALHTVCQLVLDKEKPRRVPIFGFGAKLKYPSLPEAISDYFPCNGDPEKPGVLGSAGIMQAYSFALDNIELKGHANFAPIINETMKLCEAERDKGSETYTILVILTAGQINDMEATINALNKAAHLPLSIIIFGIGDGDFSKMEILDGDRGLENKKGEKVMRDLVQFVSLRGFGGDINYLSERVFAEIPDQVVNYELLKDKDSLLTETLYTE